MDGVMCADAMTWLGHVLLVVGIVIAVLVVVPIVALLVVAIFWKKPKLVAWAELSAEEREEYIIQDPEHIDALLNPDWGAYRAQYGTEPPQVLIELYADRDLVLCQGFVFQVETDYDDEGVSVSRFRPVGDALNLDEGLAELNRGAAAVGAAGFWFALGSRGLGPHGDQYLVKPVEMTDGDGPVYVAYHDDDKIELVCSSLEALLHAERGVRLFGRRRRT